MNTNIFFILTGAGFLAGLVNFFTVYVDLPFSKPTSSLIVEEATTPLKSVVWIAITGYLVVGWAGSLLAPLLNAIVTLKGLENLSKPALTDAGMSLWILFGYGLVFGYSTTRLLVSVFDPLLKKVAALQTKANTFSFNKVTPFASDTQVGSDIGNIIDECESQWETYKADCSGFVKAVVTAFAVPLNGLADDIVDQLQTGSWTVLADGNEAKTKADAGWLVIAGLKGADNVPAQDHGHVAVIVSGPLAQGKYPTGYWGRLNGVGEKNKTINWAWNAASRNKVIYAAYQI